MSTKNINRWQHLIITGLLFFSGAAHAGYFPMYHTWAQPGGLGSQITLTYSYSNLFEGSIRDFSSGEAIPETHLRAAFETAFWDYANILPINFVEVLDNYGPLPETGEYDPTGLADIRIGQVPHIDGANAYAYFPFDDNSGLAGDIVFNAERFGHNWFLSLFYSVAQHELGHSLGMGHFVSETPEQTGTNQQQASYDIPSYPLHPLTIVALQDAYGAGSGTVSPIPLPAAFWLFMSGLMVLLGFRKQQAQQ